MIDFFNNLSGFKQFFYYLAIPSTIILIIQTLLTILGLADGGGNVDIDTDGNIDVDTDTDIDNLKGTAGLRFFSIRGLIAFFTIFGWSGVVLSDSNMPKIIILFIACIAGFTAMFLVAFLFYSITKLQSNGNINLKNSLGCTGEVYIPIPANRKGIGKIQLTIQERFREFDAMTDEKYLLHTGTIVRIIDIINSNILIVEKLNKKS